MVETISYLMISQVSLSSIKMKYFSALKYSAFPHANVFSPPVTHYELNKLQICPFLVLNSSSLQIHEYNLNQ